MAMRERVWKTFYVTGSREIRDLQAAAQNFTGDSEGYELRIDGYPGGGCVESDLPVTKLRRLFSFAGVRFPQYVTDTKPSWEKSEDE